MGPPLRNPLRLRIQPAPDPSAGSIAEHDSTIEHDSTTVDMGSIELVLSKETAIPLDSNSTVLHEIAPNERHVFVAEMARLLAPGGRLTILDGAPTSERTQGPPLHR